MALSNADSKYQAVARSVNCYFCNEPFDERAFQGHLAQCGSILDPCPNKCGVYVQRKSRNKHLSECSAKSYRPRSVYDSLESVKLRPKNIPNSQIENEIEKLKLSLEYEKQSRQEIQKQLLSIQNLHLKYLQHNKELNLAYDSLKNNWYEEIEKRKMLIQRTKSELEQIHNNYRAMEQWKSGIECDIQQMKYQIQENNNKMNDFLFRTNEHGNQLEDIKSNVDLMHRKLEDEQIKWQLDFVSLTDSFDKFQDFFQEENVAIAALWSDHTSEIKRLKENFEKQLTFFNDLKTKYHAINFELKDVKQSNLISTDIIESQNKELKTLQENLAQIKQDFDVTKDYVSISTYDNQNNGRLIWRIDNFQEKLECAKQNNTVLNGPVFYSGEYGYKLRLQVYLNGLGKWKNRHILLSLQVLKGEWDPLLLWPCDIEAKIVLRDQTASQGKHFVRALAAKRQTAEEENEDPHESSIQYIFIPHTTLEKNNYMHNNVIFFEIKITKDNLSTT